jgi:hypothetical protein
VSCTQDMFITLCYLSSRGIFTSNLGAAWWSPHHLLMLPPAPDQSVSSFFPPYPTASLLQPPQPWCLSYCNLKFHWQ